MASVFNIAQARSRFPALEHSEIVFLDNAGGTQILGSVIESIQEYLIRTNAQLGATYSTSQSSTTAYEKGYEAAARFINATLAEITIGPSTTQLLYNLSTALDFQPGDELIVSKLNHEANISPWVQVAEKLGLTLKWWSAISSTNPVCDLAQLRSLLSDKTKVVACPHASNITGTITKVKEIADIVHSFPHALLCVDGVGLAQHRQVDVKALDIDFYVFSWYKVYGPHIAQLYASSRTHSRIRPLAHFFKSHETLDLKLNLASASYELVQSLPRVIEYFGPDITGAWEAIATYEERIQAILLQFLSGNKRITIYGEPSPNKELRVPVISFTVKGMKSRVVVEEVERKGTLGFRNGHMYAPRLIADVAGLEDVNDGVVRVSMVHYNTEEEIKRLVQALKEVIPPQD